MEELKPCPFCGSTQLFTEIVEETSKFPTTHTITCCCGANVRSHKGEVEVIKKWNTRAPDTTLIDKAIEVMEESKVYLEAHNTTNEMPLTTVLGMLQEIRDKALQTNKKPNETDKSPPRL